MTFGLLGEKSGAAKKPAAKKKSQQPRVRTAPPERRIRKSQLAEISGNRLHVSNLDFRATESDLNDLFRGVGTVVSAEVVTNPKTQQSRGFAFVEMSHIDEARRAVEILHDQDFMGRRLDISAADDEEGTTSGETPPTLGSGSAAA